MKSLAIYIHWPFCVSKCPYCGFFSVKVDENFQKVEDFLFKDLIQSLEFLEKNNYGKFVISSIFFGGGTPSLMPLNAIENIISYLNRNFKFAENIEISLEANPATFDKNSLLGFKNVGVNRLSLGIQSFLDKNLEFLGRIYRSQDAYKSAQLALEIFENVNLDLMFGYRTQSFEDFKKDLEITAKYSPKHISCYELTYEPKTIFFKKLQNKEIKDISESKKIQLFRLAEKFLLIYGFKKYEISNFAKPNFECQHNLQYWQYKDYLGIGPSSHSRIEFSDRKLALEKPRNIEKWISTIRFSSETTEKTDIFSFQDIVAQKKTIQKITKEEANSEELLNSKNFKLEILTPEEEIEEILIMRLRLSSGISLDELSKKFSSNILKQFFSEPKIQFLIQQKLINKKSIQTNVLKATQKGRLYLNSIIKTLSYK